MHTQSERKEKERKRNDRMAANFNISVLKRNNFYWEWRKWVRDSDLLNRRWCRLRRLPQTVVVERHYRRVPKPRQLHLNAIFVVVTYVTLHRWICPYRSTDTLFSSRSAYFYIPPLNWIAFIHMEIPIKLYFLCAFYDIYIVVCSELHGLCTLCLTVKCTNVWVHCAWTMNIEGL